MTSLESLGGTVFADGVPEVLTASREQFRQGAQFLKIFVGGAVTGLRDPLDIVEYSPEEVQAAADEAKRAADEAKAASEKADRIYQESLRK